MRNNRGGNGGSKGQQGLIGGAEDGPAVLPALRKFSVHRVSPLIVAGLPPAEVMEKIETVELHAHTVNPVGDVLIFTEFVNVEVPGQGFVVSERNVRSFNGWMDYEEQPVPNTSGLTIN